RAALGFCFGRGRRAGGSVYQRTELQRLYSIMSDPDAPDGSLRAEWVRTRRFLDDLDWASNPVAPIIRRGIELFVEQRSVPFCPTMKRGGNLMRLCTHVLVIVAVLSGGSVVAAPGHGAGATAVATVNSTSATGVSARLGTVTFSDNGGGLLITPKLSGLPPGQ